MLLRATYDDVQEQEAEVIAYLLSQRLGGAGEERSPFPSAQDAAPGKSDMLSRIERTLF